MKTNDIEAWREGYNDCKEDLVDTLEEMTAHGITVLTIDVLIEAIKETTLHHGDKK